MEFRDQNAAAFDDILLFLLQHPYFKKLEIASEPILSFSGLKIDRDCRKVIGNGQEAKLTVNEYDIFCLLAANKGRVLTYAQIYDKVWGDLPSGNEKDNMGYHIRNLRRKICSSTSDPAISIRECSRNRLSSKK